MELCNILLYDTVINCYNVRKYFQDPFQTHLVEDGLEANEEYEISLMFHNNYTLRTALDIRNSFFHWFEVTTKPGGLYANLLCCFCYILYIHTYICM